MALKGDKPKKVGIHSCSEFVFNFSPLWDDWWAPNTWNGWLTQIALECCSMTVLNQAYEMYTCVYMNTCICTIGVDLYQQAVGLLGEKYKKVKKNYKVGKF